VSLIFSPIPIVHPALLFYLLVAVSLTFSSVGILTALVSEEFEHLAVISNFVIAPLTYFGGVFTSLAVTPVLLAYLTRFNPFFYMVDSMRFAMLGNSDAPIGFSLFIVTFLAFTFSALAVWLFKIGYKLRS
jgi:ABC-2 type transport system permease protein